MIAGSSGKNKFKAFSRRILNLANRNIAHFDFLKELTSLTAELFNCEIVGLLFRDNDKFQECSFSLNAPYQFHVYSSQNLDQLVVPALPNTLLNKLKIKFYQKLITKNSVLSDLHKGFYLNRSNSEVISKEDATILEKILFVNFQSIAFIPLLYGDEIIGMLYSVSNKDDQFNDPKNLYEQATQILGIALINYRVQAALRERVKELSCLYNIARIAEEHSESFEETIQKILELIPPAWQFPEITEGRIRIDNSVFSTSGFLADKQKQVSSILVNGRKRGEIEVIYRQTKPEIFEGPFLEEERKLIDTLAKQIALIIERREAEMSRLELEEQLRHADRLATIGQLAAGIAHELNEPLGNILGFAQLTTKVPDIPNQAKRDLDKIIHASLNAREIIKKLMLFARQIPPNRTTINLNKIIAEGVYFFETRCAKLGITLKTKLAVDLPAITGDSAQLNQVLVNLMVNAIQAMPDGGKLTISTLQSPDHASLVVEDTGHGMPDEVLNKIFIPFFTTKEIDEGTGLGLAVVHGIVTSHKGRIKVESMVNQGTRFEIQFPVSAAESEKDNLK